MGDIKKTGIATGFSEDDQKLIANLSRMGESGTGYEIKVVDEQGKESYKKLTDLSADQLKATLQAEKDRPKDIESVQRGQLNTQESMLQNLKEINEQILKGITGNQTAIKNISKGSTTLREKSREATDTYFNKNFQDNMERIQKRLGDASTSAAERKKLYEELEKNAKNMGGEVLDDFTDLFKNVKEGTPIGNEKLDELFKFFETSAKKTKRTGPELPDRGGITTTDTKINTQKT